MLLRRGLGIVGKRQLLFAGKVMSTYFLTVKKFELYIYMEDTYRQ